MAAWRRKLDALVPELRSELAGLAAPTVYTCFFELLTFTRVAHERGDEDALVRVYAFAEWCHRQDRSSDLPNAIDVAFYEHLFDDASWSMREDVAAWLSPAIRNAIMPLWEYRLAEARIGELRQLFSQPSGNYWRRLDGVAEDV